MKIAGLFAGIGGIKLGFHNALGDDVQTTLLCEWWDPAKAVLGYRFPDTELHPDVRTLIDLPADLDVLTAGFPCTDLSQAGRTAGIKGKQSGLVSRVFEMLAARRHRGLELPLLMIENVPNMLTLDRGAAMRYLIAEIEALGYTWAYRVVDSRSTGLPQRRRRVILVASTDRAPKSILFADEAGDRSVDDYAGDAFGFYWTEGKGGLGWAVDAVPTLKGGSTIGIASPPAIWLPTHDTGRDMVVPTIEDAEVMQGLHPRLDRRSDPRCEGSPTYWNPLEARRERCYHPDSRVACWQGRQTRRCDQRGRAVEPDEVASGSRRQPREGRACTRANSPSCALTNTYARSWTSRRHQR